MLERSAPAFEHGAFSTIRPRHVRDPVMPDRNIIAARNLSRA
jgi:hypothetical protein